MNGKTAAAIGLVGVCAIGVLSAPWAYDVSGGTAVAAAQGQSSVAPGATRNRCGVKDLDEVALVALSRALMA